MVSRAVNSFFAIAAICCCTTICCGQASAAAPVASSHFDIYESVLRYQIKSWDLAASTYCVEIQGKDADQEFLKRFGNLPVKPASACKRCGKSIFMTVVDKATKKPAVIFDMAGIRKTQTTELEVDGGYWCASQCIAGGTYHLSWDGKLWVVKKFEIKGHA